MKYSYWLMNIEELGPVSLGRMLENGYRAKDIYDMPINKLEAISFFNKTQKKAIEKSRATFDIDKKYDELLKSDTTFLCREEGPFPGRLKNIPNPPYGIFFNGALPDEGRLCVGIVGARSCSTYGRMVALGIGKALAGEKIQVISGLARGIDSIGQKGAMEGGGDVFAVLGTGTDICYPSENIILYRQILERGGLISEYPPKTPGKPFHFPMRNRIISAFSDAIIVVEARKKSGSLITADLALEQGKDIFAVPGMIDSKLSIGTNELIRQGAHVFTSMEGFLEDISVTPLYDHKYGPKSKKEKITLVKSERVVYSILRLSPMGIDEIVSEAGLGYREALDGVLGLILKGLAMEVTKNNYIKSADI